MSLNPEEEMEVIEDAPLEITEEKEEPLFQVRVLIDNALVGAIIGRQGANVKAVREHTGVFLSILNSENRRDGAYVNMLKPDKSRQPQERIIVLKGTLEQVTDGLRMVADLILHAGDQSEAPSTDEYEEGDSLTLRLLVHSSMLGAIIGKGGAIIQSTQQTTGARIQISNEVLPNSTEKAVSISGHPTTVHEASAVVLAQLKENPLKPGTRVAPYVPGQPVYAPPYGLPAPGGYNQSLYYQAAAAAAAQAAAAGGVPPGPPGPGGPAGAYAQQGPHHTQLHQDTSQHSTQKITIPVFCAGSVIGRGGSVVRDIRAKSGTHISIAGPNEEHPNKRVVTVTGPPSGITMAIYMISELVEKYQPRGQQYY